MDIVYPPSKTGEPSAARTKVLEEILLYFGHQLEPGEGEAYPNILSAWRENPGPPVSVFTVPNGMGHPLSNCLVYPELPSSLVYTSAAITLEILDGSGAPISGYPAVDMWLETSEGGLVLCRPGATAADSPTDYQGRTTFTGAFSCGGQTDPDGSDLLQVFVNGLRVPDVDFHTYFNSSDINGDCVVNLVDIGFFTQDYFSGYHYRSDLAADHVLNVIDIQFFAQTIGASGAKKTGEMNDNETKYSSEGTLGLFANSEGLRNNLEIVPNTPFNLYLMIKGSVSDGGLRGWECRVEAPDNVDILEWQLSGDALNMVEAPEFMVGTAEALPISGPTVLAVARCVVRDESPALFRLHPARVSSVNPANPAISVGDNETIYRLAVVKIAGDEQEGRYSGSMWMGVYLNTVETPPDTPCIRTIPIHSTHKPRSVSIRRRTVRWNWRFTA